MNLQAIKIGKQYFTNTGNKKEIFNRFFFVINEKLNYIDIKNNEIINNTQVINKTLEELKEIIKDFEFLFTLKQDNKINDNKTNKTK